MHVDVPEPVAADDHQGVAEPVEPAPQPVHGRVVGLQEVDHLEGGPRPGGLGRAVLHGHGHPRLVAYDGGLAGQGLDQGAEHRHQAPATRVDDARAPEGGELGGRPVQGVPGARVGGLGHRGRGAARVLGGLGGGGGHRKDGALDGVRDREVGGGGRPAQRRGQVAPAVRDDLRHAPQELGEDRAGVPAGADQRAVRHGPYDIGDGRDAVVHGRLGVGGEDGLDGLGRGLHRQVEVGAGVPVRDGIHVDGVDRLAVPAQRVQRQRAPAAYRDGIEGLRHLVVLLAGGKRMAAGPGGAQTQALSAG